MAATAFWRELAAALGDGHAVFLALVASATDHSPGTAGARLFLAADGRRRGTIGGGVMELRVVERARRLLADPPADGLIERLELHHRRPLDDDQPLPAGAERSGMMCAGQQTNLYCLLAPERDLATIAAAAQAFATERRARLVVDSIRGLSLEDGGEDGDPTGTDGLHGEGDAWRYTVSTLEQRRLAVLGGGHCGAALARLMAGLGWHVGVWETRPDVTGSADLDGVAEVSVVADFRHAAAQIHQPGLTPVVVMTTDVANDVRALEGVFRRGGFPFVGVMGAPAKLAEIRRRLTAAGFDAPTLGTLTAPVGLPIDSHTPGEIAVSVAAQLLAERHRWLDPCDRKHAKGGA